MARLLLALFPLLLMFHPLVACAVLATAIVLLCNKKRPTAARRGSRGTVDNDASI
jgi:hypothetical protein